MFSTNLAEISGDAGHGTGDFILTQTVKNEFVKVSGIGKKVIVRLWWWFYSSRVSGIFFKYLQHRAVILNFADNSIRSPQIFMTWLGDMVHGTREK